MKSSLNKRYRSLMKTAATGCVTITSFRVNVSPASGLSATNIVNTFLILLIEVQM